MKKLRLMLWSRSRFVLSDAIVEAVIGLLLFMVAVKIFGLGHMEIYAFAGGMYGAIGYTLWNKHLSFSWSTYEEEEVSSKRMDVPAAAMALFLPPLAALLLAVLVIAGVASFIASPFLPKRA